MRSPVVSSIVIIVALMAGFIGGRSTAPAGTLAASATTSPETHGGEHHQEPGRGAPAPPSAPTAATTTARRDNAPATPGTSGVTPATMMTTATTAAGPAASAASCEVRLEEARAELQTQLKRREELEGKALPARADVPPRFASPGLLGTFQRGFQQSGVKGSVESVDCSEHPCILFGRLEGDEGEVAKLEDSPVFAAYDDDIGVMLTWASGHGGHDDEAHPGDTKAGGAREKPEEVSLFAFAFYGTDEEGQSETIDRRIRVRTAEYWNASRPRD